MTIVTRVAARAASTQLTPVRTGRRRGINIFNDKAGTAGADLYVKVGPGPVSTTDFTLLIQAGGNWRDEYVRDEVYGLWASALGAAEVTEFLD